MTEQLSRTLPCSLCNSAHEVGVEYPSLDGADVCPMVLELNERLLEAHLREREGYPADPVSLELREAHIPLRNHFDYLIRKAYSGKPLRDDERWKLDRYLRRTDKGPIVRGTWERKRKLRENFYTPRERRRRLDMRYRYRYLLDVWKMARIPVELTEDEFVNEVMGLFMVSYVYPWMGSVAEYIRDTRDGGMGGSIRIERLDTSVPLRLGNIQLCEGLPKEMRKGRKATREVLRC
jgi:hypothetical protein